MRTSGCFPESASDDCKAWHIGQETHEFEPTEERIEAIGVGAEHLVRCCDAEVVERVAVYHDLVQVCTAIKRMGAWSPQGVTAVSDSPGADR